MLKKIVIAPDSFKGTMSSIEICNIIEDGIKNIFPDIITVKIPIADGGEGTVDAFLAAVGGERVTIKVKDPYLNEINASYGILPSDKTAVIEMAAASGLPLVKDKMNPYLTSTYGTGQLISDALNKGCRKIIIGIGGSATNDGGIGMAAALGIRFLDSNDKEITLNGKGMGELVHIDISTRDKRLDECEILVACDVDNPLYGINGAAYVFSRQKGADDNMIDKLDRNLRLFSEVIKKDLGIEVQNISGAGAAGGLGAGLIAFCGAKSQPGIQIVLDCVNFDEMIKNADLIITGEGKIDGQSLRGKVPVGIAQRALKYNIPVIAIVGDIGDDIEEVYNTGISAVFSINRKAIPFEEASKRSKQDLLDTVKSIMRYTSAISIDGNIAKTEKRST